MASITIPYAVADFIEMRERGFYYVDKTQYIAKLEDYKAPVFLRPRRFGKSLLVSTLACYYDRTKAHRFEELFGDTWIGNHPTKEHNRYMIIRYDFSAMVMSDHIQGLAQNFNDLNCGPVEVMVAHNRDLFGDFEFSNRGDASKMLEEVLTYARSHELPKVYILIDEYDNFTNQLLTAYNDPLYEEVTTNDSFLRTFFKVIKKGIGEGSIRTCFCTGVLPVTMDDLTSGYNIAEILTLEPNFLNMLGFTYEETETYLRYVLDKYSTGQDRFDEIWQLIVSNYDGYRFRPNGDRLFNATILTYFFKKFAANAGSIPDELVDENLRTDIHWIRRLTLSLDNAKTMLDALVIDDELPYNVADLASKFNKKKFFDKEFYPISLFYLGMTTLKDKFVTTLPNMTMRSVYMDYYNQLNKIEGNAQRYVPVYRHYDSNRSLEPLVQNYFEQYLGQFPAQVFDKINEKFDVDPAKTQIGSMVYAVKPGDGSAREQAASCQKVLGGLANIAKEYATKRYRSNLINWGMLPFLYPDEIPFENGDYIFVKDIKKAVEEKQDEIKAYVVGKDMKEFTLSLGALTDDERDIITKGCLINYYRAHK